MDTRTSRPKLLLIDREHSFVSLMRRLLTAEGYDVDAVTSGAEAIELLQSTAYQVVLVDVLLTDVDGLAVVREARRQQPAPVIMILTVEATLDSALRAIRLGAYDYLLKPLHVEELRLAIERALERYRVDLELISLRQLTEVFSSIRDIKKTYAGLAQKICSTLGVETCSIGLFDRTTGQIASQTTYRAHPPEGQPEFIHDVYELPIHIHLFRTGETFWTNDAGNDSLLGPVTAEHAIQSLAAVPLVAEYLVIGFIVVTNKRGGFAPSDLQLLTLVAGQATIAIENARLVSELQQTSVTDPLTGLFNLRYFTSRFHVEIERARRLKKTLALLVIDLDHLKRINDTFGHRIGDEVICEIAEILKKEARAIDLPARWGGEEFLLLLPETDLDHAVSAAERLLSRIRTIKVDAVPEVTASIGVAVQPLHANTPEELIRIADRAMYAAKQAGRNQVVPASAVLEEGRMTP